MGGWQKTRDNNNIMILPRTCETGPSSCALRVLALTCLPRLFEHNDLVQPHVWSFMGAILGLVLTAFGKASSTASLSRTFASANGSGRSESLHPRNEGQPCIAESRMVVSSRHPMHLLQVFEARSLQSTGQSHCPQAIAIVHFNSLFHLSL